MKAFKNIRFLAMIICFLLASSHASATSMAVRVTVGSISDVPGATVIVPITADDPLRISGASFTLTYDATRLAFQNANSTFFDTFEVQSAGDTKTAKLEISAANSIKALNKTLFTLSFKISNAAGTGEIPILITPSTISSPAGSEVIPVLINTERDQLNPEDTYPNVPSTLKSGSVLVVTAFVDSDNDGLDDAWEMEHFGSLITANATSDHDGDGYSDLQEYLNRNMKDPGGNLYNPKSKSAPGGSGYASPKVLPGTEDLRKIIVADFGKTGLNSSDKANGWQELAPGHVADKIAAADIDKDGTDDIIASFPGYGLYIYYSASGWQGLTSHMPEAVVSYKNGFVADFGKLGLYSFDQASGWQELAPGHDAERIAVADIDKDGKVDIIASFPGYGLYIYYSAGGWQGLTSHMPEAIVSYKDGFVGDFGKLGLYSFDKAIGWQGLAAGHDADKIAAADIDKDGTDDIIASFPGYGLYIYYSASGWQGLTSHMPEAIVSYKNGFVADFGKLGLYSFDQASGWRGLASGHDADKIAAADIDKDGTDDIIASFPGYGLYIYYSASGLQGLSHHMPQALIPMSFDGASGKINKKSSLD